MVRILNFGSLNLDYVYDVEHFVQAGETIASKTLAITCGGKGLNQSIACAKAGGSVYHAGKLGADGSRLKQLLEENKVNTDYLTSDDESNGHAIIQVNQEGNNCILLYAGSNHRITSEEVEHCFSAFGVGDYLILQNEVNLIPYMMEQAYERGMKIILNPSPITEELLEYPLNKVSLFILNEIEGKALSGEEEGEKIIDVLYQKYPHSEILLTLGEKGSIYFDGSKKIYQKAYPVKAVDTTAAGDTFTGYFVSLRAAGKDVETSLDMAARAAAIACTKKGAAASIPEIASVIK